MKKFLLIFCFCFFFLCSTSISNEKGNSFFVGAVRSEGVLIPFAFYDSGTWSSPWPGFFDPGFQDSASKVLNDSTITTLSKIPPAWAGSQKKIPVRWWKLDKRGGSILTVTKPLTVESWCGRIWALLLTGAKTPGHAHAPMTMTGIASKTNLPLSQIVNVHQDSSEWKEVFPLFDRKEYETPHLVWRLSEIMDPIILQCYQPIKELIKPKKWGYDSFEKIKIGDVGMTDFFKGIYLEGLASGSNFDSILNNLWIEAQKYQKEISTF